MRAQSTLIKTSRRQINNENNKNEPIYETFQKELIELQENGKDLKGEKKNFYNSIILRIENSIHILENLRTEHSSLRKKISQLVEEKKNRNKNFNLEQEIKHNLHDINLLKKQIDQIKHEREETLKKQIELKSIVENYRSALKVEESDESQINLIQGNLEKANIKIHETNHLIRIYNKIKNLLNKEKMHWNPTLTEKLKILEKKDKDIADLILISKDSKFSRNIAKNEYIKSDNAINSAKNKRDEKIKKLRIQSRSLLTHPQHQPISNEDSKKSRPSVMMGSHNSILRVKANKAAKEKREEKYSQALKTIEEIQEVFQTTDSKLIKKMFTEREESQKILKNQVEEIQIENQEFLKYINILKTNIEEIEFNQNKFSNGNRILKEGERIFETQRNTLDDLENEINSTQNFQNNLYNQIYHLFDLMQLVILPSDNIIHDPLELITFMRERLNIVKNQISIPDSDIINITNTFLLSQNQQPFLIESKTNENIKLNNKRQIDTLRRPTKENKNDDNNRVLDRNAVKLLSSKMSIKKPLK